MISVIMPVYNVCKIKKHFKQAVRSVLYQTYKEIEFIIVNDGSTDETYELLETMAQTDKRIHLVNKKNGGVESARRAGIGYAKGDYILHIDQDDLYESTAFDRFLKHMDRSGADVVVANSSRFIFNPCFAKSGIPKSMCAERVLGHDVFMKDYYISFFGRNILPVNIWNKMYRTSFIREIPEPPLTGHIIEDLSYNMHVLPYARKIKLIPDVLYHYRWGGIQPIMIRPFLVRHLRDIG